MGVFGLIFLVAIVMIVCGIINLFSFIIKIGVKASIIVIIIGIALLIINKIASSIYV